MSDLDTRRHASSHGRTRASLVSAACFLRGLPLFFRRAPRTPLRVLGIIALDTLHVLRHRRPLPRKKVRDLALFLDFEGCTNAAWDHKALRDADNQAIRQHLEKSGLGSCVETYLDCLRSLESRRPSIGGDRRRFDDVHAYREAVARLSLATATAIALNAECRGAEIQAAQRDPDVDTLFRILMQCQIIDDVMDYTEDLSAGLPSFLTASASLPLAMDLTARAARSYAVRPERAAETEVFPLRLALWVVTLLTKLTVRVAGRRYRHARQLAQAR